jgi:hypothetical protein
MIFFLSFIFFFYKMGEQKGRTGPARWWGVGTSGRMDVVG